MERLNVLIWHIHGSYLNSLARVNHTWFLPTKPGLPEGYGGRGSTFDLPDNMVEVPAEHVGDLELDVIVHQTPKNWTADQYEILSPRQRRLPTVYLEHNTPKPDAVNMVHPAAEGRSAETLAPLLVHVTHFNRLMWDNADLKTEVIEHAVAIPQDVTYTGEIDAGIVVVNGMEKRPRIAGQDIFERFRRSIPLQSAGMGTERYGGLGDVPYRELHKIVARHRFLFSPMRYTSLPLAVIEAMTLGMPIVALSTTELPSVLINGETGFVSNDLKELEHGMNLLMRDPDMARRMGQNARVVASKRFGLDRFRRDWDRVLSRTAAQSSERPIERKSLALTL